jgi:hypothetical protein
MFADHNSVSPDIRRSVDQNATKLPETCGFGPMHGRAKHHFTGFHLHVPGPAPAIKQHLQPLAYFVGDLLNTQRKDTKKEITATHDFCVAHPLAVAGLFSPSAPLYT